EIWVADSDGRHSVQITSGNGLACGSPRFSPDARQLVFDCHTGNGTDIYTATVDGGTPKRLTFDNDNFVPGWSRDGRWLYFTADHHGYQIWRMPAAGGEAM